MAESKSGGHKSASKQPAKAAPSKPGSSGGKPAKAAPAAPSSSLPPKMLEKLKALNIPIKGWDPDKIESVMRGHTTLGELVGISKEKQFEMAAMGVKLLKDGLKDKALDVFLGLEALDPYDAYVQVCLGTISLDEEDFEAAEERFTKALSFNPYSVPALAYRGETRLRMGKDKLGKADLEAALKNDPQSKQEVTARAKGLLAALKK